MNSVVSSCLSAGILEAPLNVCPARHEQGAAVETSQRHGCPSRHYETLGGAAFFRPA